MDLRQLGHIHKLNYKNIITCEYGLIAECLFEQETALERSVIVLPCFIGHEDLVIE